MKRSISGAFLLWLKMPDKHSSHAMISSACLVLASVSFESISLKMQPPEPTAVLQGGVTHKAELRCHVAKCRYCFSRR